MSPAVMMVRKALEESKKGEVAALVDSETQVENCRRTAQATGWTVESKKLQGYFELIFRKK